MNSVTEYSNSLELPAESNYYFLEGQNCARNVAEDVLAEEMQVQRNGDHWEEETVGHDSYHCVKRVHIPSYSVLHSKE
jgi:hypothetical protein